MIGRTSLWRAVGLAGLVAAVVASGVSPAAAGAGFTVVSTTTTAVAQGVATPLGGMVVNGAATNADLAVTVATDRGTVQVDASTGIALAYGNTDSGASVSFTGSPAQVNAALAATSLTTPDGSVGQAATVTLTAYPRQPGVVYGAATGHFYEYVPGRQTWDDARMLARTSTFLGAAGYLVTITSAAENDLVAGRIAGAENMWIGAHAVAGVAPFLRVWQWADGPEGDDGVGGADVIDRCSNDSGTCDFVDRPGYSSWVGDPFPEPNGGTDANGGESVAVTNWFDSPGWWNDLDNDDPDAAGYVVEYGDGSAFSGVATATATVAILDPPGAPTDVSAVAGTSSATVTWLASTAPDVTGYTVTASPGPATCTVGAGGTSCLLGAVADRSVTFTVVTHSRRGDSVSSQPSAAVMPTSPAVPAAPPAAAPATLTTSEGDISTVRTGQTLTVLGTGFAPFSTATVVIYSTPRVLGTATTDAAGAFSLTVMVPAELEAGAHTFVAYGVDAAGDGYAMRLPVAVPAAATATATATVPATAIAQTGVAPLPLVLLALLLLGAGMVMRLGATRARRSGTFTADADNPPT